MLDVSEVKWNHRAFVRAWLHLRSLPCWLEIQILLTLKQLKDYKMYLEEQAWILDVPCLSAFSLQTRSPLLKTGQTDEQKIDRRPDTMTLVPLHSYPIICSACKDPAVAQHHSHSICVQHYQIVLTMEFTLWCETCGRCEINSSLSKDCKLISDRHSFATKFLSSRVFAIKFSWSDKTQLSWEWRSIQAGLANHQHKSRKWKYSSFVCSKLHHWNK